MSQQRRSQNTGSTPGPRPFTYPTLPDPSTLGHLIGGGGSSALVLSRLREQYQAVTSVQGPAPSTRLAALRAVYPHLSTPGSVGSGAFSGISAIHLALGNTLQAHIGNVFRSSGLQQFLGQPAGRVPNLWTTPWNNLPQSFSPANWATGWGEHQYWRGQLRQQVSEVAGHLHPPVSGLSSFLGGVVGTAFRPTLRATAQSIAARNPYLFPVIAAGSVIGGGTYGGGLFAQWYQQLTGATGRSGRHS